MIDAIHQIVNGFANQFRKEWLSIPVIYKTKEGKEHAIYATPWAVSDFQGLQQIGYDVVNLSRFHAAFTVLKEQLIFEGEFYEPVTGDQIIDKDGIINTVSANSGMPQWYYAENNPEKNTIIINCTRMRGEHVS